MMKEKLDICGVIIWQNRMKEFKMWSICYHQLGLKLKKQNHDWILCDHFPMQNLQQRN